MASSTVPPSQRRRDAIERWQAAAGIISEAPGSTGVIGSLYEGLMDFLKHVLQKLRKQDPRPSYYQSLEASSATLLFWGQDLGVSNGELDIALQHSNRLRDTLLVILMSIGHSITRGLIAALPSDKELKENPLISNIETLIENARISLKEPDELEDDIQSDVRELCSILKTKIDSLVTLSSSLECPAEDESDDEEVKNWVDIQDRAAHEYFVDLISSRFPNAEKALVERLGRSNWSRYNYVQEQRESAQYEEEVLETDRSKSVFHDSGIGSSAPAQSITAGDAVTNQHLLEYAATVVSSRAEASHKRLPSLPEEGREGKPFTCEVCDKVVSIQRTKEWKEHIFSDLCAYTCIFGDCTAAGILFENREAMICHFESEHGINRESEGQSCPLCLEEIRGGRNKVTTHFSRHMEEIALGVLPRIAESDSGSESGNESEESKDDEKRPDLDHSSYIYDVLPPVDNPPNWAEQPPEPPDLPQQTMPQLLQFQNTLKAQHPDWTLDQVQKVASEQLTRFMTKQRVQAINAASGATPGMSPSPQLGNNMYLQNSGIPNSPSPNAVQNYQNQLLQQQRMMSQQQRQQAGSPPIDNPLLRTWTEQASDWPDLPQIPRVDDVTLFSEFSYPAEETGTTLFPDSEYAPTRTDTAPLMHPPYIPELEIDNSISFKEFPPVDWSLFDQTFVGPPLANPSSNTSPTIFQHYPGNPRAVEQLDKGVCPMPECGRVFKDLKAHMLTHQNERPFKCPITSCEYHIKGFARKNDHNRHTLTHYKKTMVCSFCPGAGSAAEKSFNRADVFKRHLTYIHGAEQNPPNSRRKNPSKKAKAHKGPPGKCSTCSVDFSNVQDFYEHFDECVLRVVAQQFPEEGVNATTLATGSKDKDTGGPPANSGGGENKHQVPSE